MLTFIYVVRWWSLIYIIISIFESLVLRCSSLVHWSCAIFCATFFISTNIYLLFFSPAYVNDRIFILKQTKLICRSCKQFSRFSFLETQLWFCVWYIGKCDRTIFSKLSNSGWQSLFMLWNRLDSMKGVYKGDLGVWCGALTVLTGEYLYMSRPSQILWGWPSHPSHHCLVISEAESLDLSVAFSCPEQSWPGWPLAWGQESSFLTCLSDYLILLVSAHLNLFANFWLGSCGTRNTADDLFSVFFSFSKFSKTLSCHSYNVALKNLHFLIWQSNVGVRATAVLTNSYFCAVSNVCEDHSP